MAVQKIRDWAKRLKRDALALWFACRSPLTPWYAKALAVFTVGYALSPIDLIPDFIPVLGFVDDAILLPALIWVSLRLIPPEVMEQCRAEADRSLERGAGKPRSYLGAGVIVVLWAGAAYWSWTAFVRG
jgi:uncharacterized membrane protein YkvA (DUF1232 family)